MLSVTVCDTRKADRWLRNGSSLKLGKSLARVAQTDDITFSVVWSNRSVGTWNALLSKRVEESVVSVAVYGTRKTKTTSWKGVSLKSPTVLTGF